MGKKRIYDLPDIMKNFHSFYKKFIVLKEFGGMTKLERRGCKLGHMGGNLYIAYHGNMQGISRWWWGETRDNLLDYIVKETIELLTFLELVTEVIQKAPTHESIEKLRIKNKDFVLSILPGFKAMRNIYLNYHPLEQHVQYVINELTAFLNIWTLQREK